MERRPAFALAEVAVQTADGVFRVDVDEEEVIGFEQEAEVERVELPDTGLPRVVAGAAAGATVIAVVDRRPPLLVSHDAGSSWKEAGGGLPAGRAVVVDSDDPDLVVYAARNRLYVSRDGGRFWSALPFELPEIEAITIV